MLLLIGSLICGTWGFLQVNPKLSLSSAAYLAAQMIPLNSGAVPEPVPWGVDLARWLAPAATLGGMIQAGWILFRGSFRSLRGRLVMRRHTIVCGAGERGSAIARREMEHGRRVTVVEMDPLNDMLGELRAKGAHVVEGNVRDAEVLKEAGVERAARIVAVTSSDETNLSVAREAAALAEAAGSTPERIFAAVEAFEVRSYFRDRLPSLVKNGRVVGFQCRASRQLMLREAERLVRQPAVRARGVVIMIEACDTFRDELIRAATLMMQFSAEQRPTLLVCGACRNDEDLFRSRFPAADLVVDLRWSPESADKVLSEGTNQAVDLAIFALNSDAQTVEAAERFRLRHDILAEAVVACLRDGGELGQLAKDCSRNKGTSVTMENLYALSLEGEDPLDEAAEEEAKAMHNLYVETEIKQGRKPEENPSLRPWAEITELLRDSNRLAILHQQVKRAAWVERGTLTEQAMLTHLTRSEHMRWMAEKVMDGWRASTVKNPTEEKQAQELRRLRHYCFVPFDELSQANQDKDLANVRKALGLTP